MSNVRLRGAMGDQGQFLRSAGTGIFDSLAKYNLPSPAAVFDINYFKADPAPFYMIAKELLTGQYKPTPTHNFIRLLNDHGYLQCINTKVQT